MQLSVVVFNLMIRATDTLALQAHVIICLINPADTNWCTSLSNVDNNSKMSTKLYCINKAFTHSTTITKLKARHQQITKLLISQASVCYVIFFHVRSMQGFVLDWPKLRFEIETSNFVENSKNMLQLSILKMIPKILGNLLRIRSCSDSYRRNVVDFFTLFSSYCCPSVAAAFLIPFIFHPAK